MSSWLGSSLSNISGQISNFTREVLTEGTEEVDDPATQLRLAKTHIGELQRQNESQKFEAEKLKHVNVDLTERLESAELQINAISNEYRDLLTLKENEVKELKHSQHEYEEAVQKLQLSGGSAASHSHNPVEFASGHADEHDFHDVISSQHEINRLRSEVRKLDAENQRLRQATQGQVFVANEGGDTPNDSLSDLHTRIKELESKLRSEVDEHQHELATLQDVHSQKLSMLKKKHKQEIRNYDEQIADLHELIETDGESTAAARKVQELQAQLDLLNKEKQTAEEKKRLTAAAGVGIKADPDEDSFSRDQAQLVSSTPKPKRSPTEGVEQNAEVLQNQHKQLQQEFELVKADWQMEKEALEEVLVKLRQDLRLNEDSVSNLQQENEDLQRELFVRANSTSTDNLENDNKEELLSLKKQLLHREDEQKTIVAGLKAKQTENTKILSQMQALQESSQRTLQKLGQLEVSLKEKDEQLAAVTYQMEEAQEELANASTEQGEISALLSEIQGLRSEIDNQGSEITDVSSEVMQKDEEILNLTHMLSAKEDLLNSANERRAVLENEIQESTQKVEQLTEELNNTSRQLESVNDELQSSGKEKEKLKTVIVETKEEKESLMISMEELDTQNQIAISKILQVRDKLMKHNEELKLEVGQLKRKLAEAQKKTQNNPKKKKVPTATLR